MAQSKMPMKTPQDLFVHELSDMLSAEQIIAKMLGEAQGMVQDPQVKQGLQQHEQETQQHIRNLEQVFGELGEEPRRDTNEVARGLVSEAQEGIQEAQSDALRDCVINAAVIKVEHFEMGSYRGLVTGARLMERPMIVDVLEANMQQEEETAQIAEQSAPELLQKVM